MKFIKITPVHVVYNSSTEDKIEEGIPYYINMDKVNNIQAGKLYTCIYYDEPGNFLRVKETPEEIINMVETDFNSRMFTDEELREVMKDPKYWRERDPEYVKKIEEGFRKLYGK